jgi:hypothetical protein
VIHSADHVSAYEIGKVVAYPTDGTRNFRAYLRSIAFLVFWMLPINSVFQDQYLRTRTLPFYKALYEELERVDPFLANATMKSCSY